MQKRKDPVSPEIPGLVQKILPDYQNPVLFFIAMAILDVEKIERKNEINDSDSVAGFWSSKKRHY